MDAKTRANFINSVAEGKKLPCPKCGAENETDRKSCAFCGTDLTAPAFAPVEEKVPFQKTYVEPVSAFADGLPSWDITPPQIMVRRH